MSRAVRVVARLAALFVVVLAACSAQPGASEPTTARTHPLLPNAGSIPYPVLVDQGTHVPVKDAAGKPVPAWDGSVVDLMAADAWAECSQSTSRDASDDLTEADEYLVHLMQRMGTSECSASHSSAATVPLRWLAQRQTPACNVDTSTGELATLAFRSHDTHLYTIANGTTLVPASSRSVRAKAMAEAQKQLEVGEVNLCLAQRLREYQVGADGLLLSGADQRELLEVVRERAQVSALQYALLGLAFSVNDQYSDHVSDERQFIPVLHWWATHSNDEGLTQFGGDFAAAVKLLADSGQELATLLARSASAGADSGQFLPKPPDRVWGERSWRQRLDKLMYGGSPLIGLTQFPKDDGWSEPSSSYGEKYVSEAVPAPEIDTLLGLARSADVLNLATLPESNGNAESLRTIDLPTTSRRLYRAVEAWIRKQDCLAQSLGTVCDYITAASPAIPDPSAYGSYELWKRHRVRPEHAASLAAELSQAMPRVRYRYAAGHALSEREDPGVFHFIGAHQFLQDASAPAPVPGENESLAWYHLDPKFGVIPFGHGDRAAPFVDGTGFRLPKALDRRMPGITQGFVARWSGKNAALVPPGMGGISNRTMRQAGLLGALGAIRDAILSGTRGDQAQAVKKYFGRADLSLKVIGAAIGVSSVSVRPDAVVALVGGNCQEWGKQTTAMCLSFVLTNDHGWQVSVVTKPDDPYDQLLVVRSSDGLEATAALDPDYRSFAGRTRAQLLAGTPVGPDVVEDIASLDGTVRRTYRVSLPAPSSGPWTLLLARTPPVTGGTTDYVVLGQSWLLPTFCTQEYSDLGGGLAYGEVCRSQHGRFLGYGGTLGTIRMKAWATHSHNWAKPAFDGFGIPVDWVPPSDPALYGSQAGDNAAAFYLRSARAAAEEATQAVKYALEHLLEQQKDDLAATAARKKAAELDSIEQQSLCGSTNPQCDTGTTTLTIDSVAPRPSCWMDPPGCPGAPGCFCSKISDVAWRAFPETVEVARPVATHIADEAPPEFAEYRGGTLQKLLIEQWGAVKKLQRMGRDFTDLMKARRAQVDTASEALAATEAQIEYECYHAMNLAFEAGFSLSSVTAATCEALGHESVTCPVGVGNGLAWSPGPLMAQYARCDQARIGLPAEKQKLAAVVAEAWLAASAQMSPAIEASAAVRASVADFFKAAQDARLAKAKNALEESLALSQLPTRLGTYRRYHSYDMWRARALLESARRYAGAARRAIEARYVVDMSEMTSPEAFVAAPATWADEVYEYDLDAPSSVGLSPIVKTEGGIYPNRVSDYVGNLERFVQGYAISRPTALARTDAELLSIPGPDLRKPAVIQGETKQILAEDSFGWAFYCPNLDAWRTHPALDPVVGDPAASLALVCGVLDNSGPPTRARVLFHLDPWGRMQGNIAAEPYSKRHNARWARLALNLVGTGIKDCSVAPDPIDCYSQSFVRYQLGHVGPAWVTNFAQQWRALNVPIGRIESGKALAAEQWLDPVSNSWAKPYVEAVARQELLDRPFGGAYELEIEVTPDVKLERIQRVQILTDASYWVAQQ
jgi:hypothetical protein